MSGGNQLEQIEIDLRNVGDGSLITVYISVWNSSLSRKWLESLIDLVRHQYHLEKNFCFLGFADSNRNGEYILQQINLSIDAINKADLGYKINDWFDLSNTVTDEPYRRHTQGRNIIHARLNQLHRYFEDLQGTSGSMSPFYCQADAATRWHIRQLNLLCHEFECWALSWRKQLEDPEWIRPSQLMCWLNAPRFVLDHRDYELFGIDTINRPLGGVFVGVNKAVGKHHWEVFNDEGRDSRISELTTSTLKSQTEAAGDFDIEWANDPGKYNWQQIKLREFSQWLTDNGFDPNNPELTIGHPQVGQVDLMQTFGTTDYQKIWKILNSYLDVYEIRVAGVVSRFDYHWSDLDYQQRQTEIIKRKEKC